MRVLSSRCSKFLNARIRSAHRTGNSRQPSTSWHARASLRSWPCTTARAERVRVQIVAVPWRCHFLTCQVDSPHMHGGGGGSENRQPQLQEHVGPEGQIQFRQGTTGLAELAWHQSRVSTSPDGCEAELRTHASSS